MNLTILAVALSISHSAVNAVVVEHAGPSISFEYIRHHFGSIEIGYRVDNRLAIPIWMCASEFGTKLEWDAADLSFTVSITNSNSDVDVNSAGQTRFPGPRVLYVEIPADGWRSFTLHIRTPVKRWSDPSKPDSYSVLNQRRIRASNKS